MAIASFGAFYRVPRADCRPAQEGTHIASFGGKGFERPDSQGLMKRSSIILHNDAADRPANMFAGTV